jgi:hypothetical protein
MRPSLWLVAGDSGQPTGPWVLGRCANGAAARVRACHDGARASSLSRSVAVVVDCLDLPPAAWGGPALVIEPCRRLVSEVRSDGTVPRKPGQQCRLGDAREVANVAADSGGGERLDAADAAQPPRWSARVCRAGPAARARPAGWRARPPAARSTPSSRRRSPASEASSKRSPRSYSQVPGGPGAAGSGEALAAAQEELAEAVAGAHRIVAHVFYRTHEIAELLIGPARDRTRSTARRRPAAARRSPRRADRA